MAAGKRIQHVFIGIVGIALFLFAASYVLTASAPFIFGRIDTLHPAAAPVKAFTLDVGDNGQDQFAAQMKKFAAANGFEMNTSQFTPDRRSINMELRRGNIRVIALNPFSVSEFNVAIEQNAGTTTPQETIAALAQSLKTFVPELKDDPRSP